MEVKEEENNLNPEGGSESIIIKNSNIPSSSSVHCDLDILLRPSTSESFSSLSKAEDSDIADPSDEDNVANTPTVLLSPVDDKTNKNSTIQAMNITVEEAVSQSDDITIELTEPLAVSERKVDTRITPKIDCQEKIIFCVDLSSEMNEHPFKLGNGGQFSPLSMVKRVIEIFVHSKLMINSKHEFAVVGFFDIAIWFQGFTSDPKEITDALDALNEVRPCQKSALSSIFTIVSVFASQQPFFFKPDIILPHYALRVILIYGRSNCIPESLENIDMLQTLKDSPYFFLDVLYIHDSPSEENKCQEIFERLCDLDENDTSYIFEVARNTTKLHNCMAKLLAHPLQRPLQKCTYYKLQNTDIQT